MLPWLKWNKLVSPAIWNHSWVCVFKSVEVKFKCIKVVNVSNPECHIWPRKPKIAKSSGASWMRWTCGWRSEALAAVGAVIISSVEMTSGWKVTAGVRISCSCGPSPPPLNAGLRTMAEARSTWMSRHGEQHRKALFTDTKQLDRSLSSSLWSYDDEDVRRCSSLASLKELQIFYLPGRRMICYNCNNLQICFVKELERLLQTSISLCVNMPWAQTKNQKSCPVSFTLSRVWLSPAENQAVRG